MSYIIVYKHLKWCFIHSTACPNSVDNFFLQADANEEAEMMIRAIMQVSNP